MNDVRVSVSASTDVGMQRAGNEDSFLVADLSTGDTVVGADTNIHSLGERGSLMIVSDGMGGAAAGEVASEMAVTIIREAIAEMPASMEISERLKTAAETANERIWNHAQSNMELSGMGATLTAALVQGTTAYIAQVGDSRAYLVRGERIKQLTKDQSLAQMLVDSGAIKPEQIDSVPQNVIMQALGTQPVVKVAMTAVGLFRSDCLVICSDGLSNKVTSDELRAAASGTEDLTEACRKLIATANERGGEDNITVVIARFDGEALHSAGDGKSITESLRPLDKGYFSDYIPTNPDAWAADLDDAGSSEDVGPQVTSMLRAADTGQLETSAAGAFGEDEFSSRPTAGQPAFEQLAQQGRQKQSYRLILIIALISLLLLGATGYFVYSVYLKQKPLPAVEEPPE
ncbi:MAG TPA: PP2C family serine/threonine-protein phosphatase [Blastocatellia bacterium]|nr:PP2C family serine/threonine-protein phosphatase [Blastocatellia bacterium]